MNKKTLDLLPAGAILLAIAIAMIAFGILPELSRFTHIPYWVWFIVLLILLMTAYTRATLKLIARPPTLWGVDSIDSPLLDRHTFDYYDAQLIGLGFEPRFCYASELPHSAAMKGLARLYYHTTHRCLATNGQIFQGNARMAVVFVISKLGDNWSLRTSNVKPNPIQCAWRRPRALWNMIPGGEPRELLDAHLQVRQRMIDGLSVGNSTDDIEQHAYFELLLRNHRQNHEALRKKNIILLYLARWFYKIKPIYSWMGDLEKAVKDRQAF